LPVVAYDLPIYKEIFPTGMVKTALEDEAAFAAEVLRLLGDPAWRERAVAKARARAAVFDWAAIAEREMGFVTGR
jgi:glycosyltransferase involved in cell wall biosynthesis